MKPENLTTKIFLDSGDPKETKEVIKILGFLDGQTTNPSLFAKNPEVIQQISNGQKFSKSEINDFYKKIIQEISQQIPAGSVSIEVYADMDTSTEEIISQAHEMNKWISNAHIKLPITPNALVAAEKLIKDGIRLNMTLCFSQEQGAAVYSATKGAKKGDVFLSPFIGRLDDISQNGMSFIENMTKMYKFSDGHVEVLAASARNLDHFLRSLQLNVDIITAPAKVLIAWAEKNFMIPRADYTYDKKDLQDLPYESINLNKHYSEYNIQHELTDQGIVKFAADWNKLLK